MRMYQGGLYYILDYLFILSFYFIVMGHDKNDKDIIWKIKNEANFF